MLSKCRFLVTVYLIFFNFFAVINLYAEESQNPFQKQDEFYQHDYAKDPLNIPLNQKTISPKDLPSNTDLSEEAVPDNTESQQTNTNSNSNQSQGLSIDSLTGPKVQTVGVIFNGMKPENYTAILPELKLLADTHNIQVGQVTAISTHKEFNSNFQALVPLLLYRAQLSCQQSIPEKYSQITKSPTWIVGTTEGEILIEGVKNLARYINKQGNFIEQSLSMPEPKPSPSVFVPAGGKF